MKFLLLSIASLAICMNAPAQTSQVADHAESGERKLISKPPVKIPSAARKTKIGGTLNARVSVDDEGHVVSVDSISGPGAVCPQATRPDVLSLREAVRTAALQSRFTAAKPGTSAGPSTAVVTFDVKGERNNSENAMISGYDLPEKPGKAESFAAAEAPHPEKTEPEKRSDHPSALPKVISGGVLNHKAIELPRPAFPRAAMAVRATGSVPVQVLIDEDGNIFIARATGGHPLLRAAAVTAACGARFMPTLLSGSPVKVAGVITYNFVP